MSEFSKDLEYVVEVASRAGWRLWDRLLSKPPLVVTAPAWAGLTVGVLGVIFQAPAPWMGWMGVLSTSAAMGAVLDTVPGVERRRSQAVDQRTAETRPRALPPSLLPNASVEQMHEHLIRLRDSGSVPGLRLWYDDYEDILQVSDAQGVVLGEYSGYPAQWSARKSGTFAWDRDYDPFDGP